jgi:hypothetical protein
MRERTDDLSNSLEQQTATADVLKAISRSTFDLQTVLDTLVNSAARLCRAEKANIALPRDGTFEYLANVRFSSALVEHMQSLKLRVQRGSITARSVFEGKTVHVHDVLSDPEFVYTRGAEPCSCPASESSRSAKTRSSSLKPSPTRR